MFINSVSDTQNFYRNSGISNKLTFRKGLNPEIIKNQYKILMCQDIWAEKLKIRKPESPIEKEVLLEVLQNRLKLDRFTRLNNYLFKLKTKVGYINSLIENSPANPELPKLKKEVEKLGNLQSVYKTLNKQIKLEAAKNKSALEYFNNIDHLQEEYLERKLINSSKMYKYWKQMEKNNINENEKYNTNDLINIITDSSKFAISKSAHLSKKQLLDKVTLRYEDLLRERINIYGATTNHTPDAIEAQRILAKENLNDLKRFPDIAKQINKICKSIENKIKYKADRLGGIYIHPIGEIWHDMNIFKSDIKLLSRDIENIKEQLVKEPDNELLKVNLKIKEDLLNKTKENWLTGLKYSLKYEAENRQRMIDGDREAEYNYLTEKNPILNKYKEFLEIANQYSEKIPEDVWTKFLA